MEGNNYKVLVVDDAEENLKVIWGILSDTEIDVLFAENGNEAIKIAKKKFPDLILLDINMPELNGYETCKVLKQDEATKEIPVIFLSALNDKGDIVKGFNCGGVDYITKPFNHAELISRVNTHLELKTSKELLKKQNEELKELVATKNKFFSIIAHDLKSPFSFLLGYSNILNERLEEFEIKNLKEILKQMHSGLHRTYVLLENLLLWTQSQKGMIKYKPQKENLYEIAEQSKELLMQSAMAKSIELVNTISEDIYIVGDKEMLASVFRNLISNSIKFTHRDGRINIGANILPESDNESAVEVSIEDNGVGIPEGKILSLFKIAESDSTSGTENEKGTGLGLILCKEFIEKHGGEIKVISNEGKGSRFFFTLKRGAK